MRLAPLAIFVALALAPAAADAATVRVDTRCENPTGKGPESCGGVLVFQAAPGEANNVSADPPAAGAFVIRDAGAPLTAGTGCTQIDAASARCPTMPGMVSLGDGNDRLSFPAALEYLPVSGGAGDDAIAAPGTVLGGDGDDALSGTRLDGGAGNDILTGTPGEDVLFGDIGDDTIDGGPGLDTVEYGLRASFAAAASRPGPAVPVTVDLADPGADGAAGERDTLVAIENVRGSDAKGDLLRGDDGPNILRGGGGGADQIFGAGGEDDIEGDGELDGGDGDDKLRGGDSADTLRGGRGDDSLAGVGGADVMDGGAGDDLLDGSEQEPERTLDVDELRCGEGRDRVSQPDIYDRASSCERIAIGGGLVVNSATLRKRPGPRVEVTVLCARSDRSCATTVASAAASGVAFNPRRRLRLAPGARKHLVLNRFHPGAKARLRRSRVIALGTKDHGFAVRIAS